MRNHQQSAVAKFFADAALDQRVRVHVDGRRGLVEDHDLGPRDDGPRQAEELPLALREVEAAFGDAGVEGVEDVRVGVCGGGGGGVGDGRGGGGAAGGRAHDSRGGSRAGDEVDALEGVAELDIGVLVESVEVAADGAGEQDGVLRDDGQSAAEIVQFHRRDVEAVDADGARARFEEAEEGERER